MPGKVGLDCKLYYNAVSESPTWTELVAIDVETSLEIQSAELSNRDSVWVKELPTLLSAGLTFNMIWDPEDTGMLALRTAAMGRTPLMFAILDGDKDTSSTQGRIVTMFLSNASENQPLREGVTISFEGKLAYGYDDPEDWAGD